MKTKVHVKEETTLTVYLKMEADIYGIAVEIARTI